MLRRSWPDHGKSQPNAGAARAAAPIIRPAWRTHCRATAPYITALRVSYGRAAPCIAVIEVVRPNIEGPLPDRRLPLRSLVVRMSGKVHDAMVFELTICCGNGPAGLSVG